FAIFTAPTGDPHIAGSIGIEAVRPIDEAAPKNRNHLSAGVQLHHRIDRRTDASVAAAALEQPECLSVAIIDLHPDRRSKFAAIGQLNAKLLHTIRIRGGVWIICVLSVEQPFPL